jgi:hypothetical protein
VNIIPTKYKVIRLKNDRNGIVTPRSIKGKKVTKIANIVMLLN